MLIAQLSDLHLRPPGRMAYRVVDTNRLTEQAVAAVEALRPRPDLLLLTGDLTYAGLAEEYAVLVDILRRATTVPVRVIPGNHDLRAPMRGVVPGLLETEGFFQAALDLGPVRLILLDTVIENTPEGDLCPARLDFLRRALEAAPDRPTIIAMHHPPFACGLGHMDRINLRDPGPFIALVGRHRQVMRILCGHHHRPVFAGVAGTIACIAPSVAHQVELDLRDGASGAFVLEPPAFYLHRWTAADGLVTHTAYVGPHPGPYAFAG